MLAILHKGTLAWIACAIFLSGVGAWRGLQDATDIDPAERLKMEKAGEHLPSSLPFLLGLVVLGLAFFAVCAMWINAPR